MADDLRLAFHRAVKNIVGFGDTDIFPFPIENHIFHDDLDAVVELLQKIHSNFDHFLNVSPPINNSDLAPVGYTGFRWATQIDPVWNAYFLGLVIALGERIEASRLPTQEQRVFTYRFKPIDETGAIFDSTIGWAQFQKHSLALASKYEYVLICDISDFYSRIYHHRLENSLTQLKPGNDYHSRIMSLLKRFSNNNSYGLPIGGPAARLLSELLLNRTDRLFKDDGIEFCRFADDYHVFANTKEDAYRNLIFMSEKLLRNEGLSLQKAKTRIMPSKEFVAASEFHLEEAEGEQPSKEVEAREFLRISLKYDPYSQTADDDYEALREEVRRFDIVGMLARELAKSRVHSALTKKLIASIRFLTPKARDQAIESLTQNLEVLAPAFGVVMIAIKNVYSDLSPGIRKVACEKLKNLIHERSHLVQVDINLGYALRILSIEHSDDKEALFAQIYKTSLSDVIKRDIILVMAKWGSSHWISDRKNYYSGLSQWEKRAFIIASYSLGEEGNYWRQNTKASFSEVDKLYRDWAARKLDGSGALTFSL